MKRGEALGPTVGKHHVAGADAHTQAGAGVGGHVGRPCSIKCSRTASIAASFRRSMRASPWLVSQLHEISGWAAPAGVYPGRRANPQRKPNFQTSGYGASLVANAIMLSNVVDMSDAIEAMVDAGAAVTPELLSATSPYLRVHIRRLGQYVFDMTDLPGPLDPRPPPLAKALRPLFTRILNLPLHGQTV